MIEPEPSDDALLDALQRAGFNYFLQHSNPDNGLIADTSRPDAPCSIAAVGMALACYPIAVERGYLSRFEARTRTLAALRFFQDAPHGPQPDATGHNGFYYHFLDMRSGRRARKCELSSIDTTLLLAGVLTAAAYFDAGPAPERELRERAETLYQRADWNWMHHSPRGDEAVAHGWKPESGFLKARWSGYNEALLLYVLALGSPSHPLPPASYAAWCATYKWKTIYDYQLLYAGPMFVHQMSHAWLDFREIQDEFMRAKASDYFENSRRATCVQREYARRNPRGFAGYHEQSWGLSAGDGPGTQTQTVNGRKRRFWDYQARGVPFGPDDGTLTPDAALASLPFCPDIVLPALRHFDRLQLRRDDVYGFVNAYNPGFPADGTQPTAPGWVSTQQFGINVGPALMMIENFRSGLIWNLMRDCPSLQSGLRRASFTGGWLNPG